MQSNTISYGFVKPDRRQFVSSCVEWFGSIMGIVGALILAANMPWSGYGWIAFLVSNAAWITYAALGRIKSLLMMQVVFTATSLLGAYRYLY
jgi:hypothetical protein